MQNSKSLIIARLLLLVCGASVFSFSFAQTTLHTSGKNVLDVCGDTVLLRGIDYAPFNWGNDNSSEETAEIEKTGANCVRLVWYVNGGGAAYYTNDYLDTILTHCAAHQLIPIIELHDQTCANDSAALITLAGWYTQPGVVSVLQKHKAYIVGNIANEALYHNWANVPATAVNTYVNTYSAIISSIRAAGLDFPLVIDAPDCGTDISLFSTVAPILNANDTKHNLIFSSHAYWYSYANNDSAQMAALVAGAAALNYPVIFGEFGNYQDDAHPCDYVLNYTALLHLCETYHMPWICWSWDQDNCMARQISTTGMFNSLSAYGNDVVNNTGYGLKYKAIRTHYFLNGSCSSMGITALTLESTSLNVSQISSQTLHLLSTYNQVQQVIITDVLGRAVWQDKLGPGQPVDVKLASGVYVVESDKQKAIKQVIR